MGYELIKRPSYKEIDNSREVVALIGLDVSAAFDTVSHDILMKRLHLRFGIRDTALDWIASYLTERYQYVMCNNTTSEMRRCEVGVPQGSVLGPLLFTAYESPIADIISSFGIIYHQYAAYTQLYTAIKSASKRL